MSQYRIYTDGACSGNSGPGGYAAVILNGETVCLRLSGHEEYTTNNRMELKAIVRGIKQVASFQVEKARFIEVISDSRFCLDPIEFGWIDFWKKNDWKTKEGEVVKNDDLWRELDKLLQNKKIKVKFTYVKGHSGDKYNEMADTLAKEAIKTMRGKGQ